MEPVIETTGDQKASPYTNYVEGEFNSLKNVDLQKTMEPGASLDQDTIINNRKSRFREHSSGSIMTENPSKASGKIRLPPLSKTPAIKSGPTKLKLKNNLVIPSIDATKTGIDDTAEIDGPDKL